MQIEVLEVAHSVERIWINELDAVAGEVYRLEVLQLREGLILQGANSVLRQAELPQNGRVEEGRRRQCGEFILRQIKLDEVGQLLEGVHVDVVQATADQVQPLQIAQLNALKRTCLQLTEWIAREDEHLRARVQAAGHVLQLRLLTLHPHLPGAPLAGAAVDALGLRQFGGPPRQQNLVVEEGGCWQMLTRRRW